MDGRLVDLNTMAPASAAAGEDTRPQFPLDSIANDKNFPGLEITPSLAGDDFTPPEVLPPGERPALFEAAEQLADDAGEEVLPEVKEDVSSDKTAKSGKKKR